MCAVQGKHQSPYSRSPFVTADGDPSRCHVRSAFVIGAEPAELAGQGPRAVQYRPGRAGVIAVAPQQRPRIPHHGIDERQPADPPHQQVTRAGHQQQTPLLADQFGGGANALRAAVEPARPEARVTSPDFGGVSCPMKWRREGRLPVIVKTPAKGRLLLKTPVGGLSLRARNGRKAS